MNIGFPELLAQILNGIQFGVMIALLATGLSLIFGMLGFINFAHGALYTSGAYFLYTVMRFLLPDFPGKFWIGIIITFVFMGVFGLLIQQSLLKRISGQNPVYSILLTFGLIWVIQQGIALVYGATPLQLGIPSGLSGTINLGVFSYPKYWLITLVIGLVLIFLFWYFIEHSNLGFMIRATAENPEIAAALGVNVDAVYKVTFALGVALAGLGGALHAPTVGGLRHTIGEEILIISFIVVVIGGLGSIRGALLGGIILGIARGITAIVWAPASDFVMLGSLVVILIIRPQGLLGKQSP